MQASEFLFLYYIVIAIIALLFIGFTILRWMAVKQYRLVRAGEAGESTLSALGDKVSNSRWYIFDSLYIIIFILVISQVLPNLGMLVGFDVLQLPVLVLALGLLLGSILFLQFTIRGQAYRRTEQIIADHQTIGHEDLIIRKHLAELIHESEGDDDKQAAIARATLENLQYKENRTGDAVRQILENPDQLREMPRMKKPPSLWKSFRVSLLILSIAVLVVVYLSIAYLSGALLQYEFFTNLLTIFFLGPLTLVACLCVESNRARTERKRVLFGV